jgi:hypothetical protein
MSSDIVLRLQPARLGVKRVFSFAAARQLAYLVALVLWSVGIPLATLALYAKLRRKHFRRALLLRLILPACGTCAIVGLVIYVSVEKVEVGTGGGSESYSGLYGEMRALVEKPEPMYPQLAEKNLTEVASIFERHFREAGIQNVFTGKPIDVVLKPESA